MPKIEYILQSFARTDSAGWPAVAWRRPARANCGGRARGRAVNCRFHLEWSPRNPKCPANRILASNRSGLNKNGGTRGLRASPPLENSSEAASRVPRVPCRSTGAACSPHAAELFHWHPPTSKISRIEEASPQRLLPSPPRWDWGQNSSRCKAQGHCFRACARPASGSRRGAQGHAARAESPLYFELAQSGLRLGSL